MKTAVILINGDLSTMPDLNTLVKSDEILICADGAAEQAYKQNIIPHVIVGDLDSLDPKIKEYYIGKNVKIEKYPTEKDFTDSEIAIRYAVDQKVNRIIICGILGSRVDHQLSNLFFLSKIAKKTECIIIEGNTYMYFIYDSLIIKGAIGDELSLIPLNSNCISVATEGLKYSLSNEPLYFSETRGISNIFKKKEVKVTINEGILLALHRKLY